MSGECKHEKMISRENLKILNPTCAWESVNQITVWRVNPETCVERVSMKKMKSCENSKNLNLTCAWRV